MKIILKNHLDHFYESFLCLMRTAALSIPLYYNMYKFLKHLYRKSMFKLSSLHYVITLYNCIISLWETGSVTENKRFIFVSPDISNEIMGRSCEIFGLDQLLLLEHQKFHQTFIFFARLLDFKGLAEKRNCQFVVSMEPWTLSKKCTTIWLLPLSPSLTWLSFVNSQRKWPALLRF